MASKRLRAALSAKEEEMSIDMSPMIDMVFLLLIFFIVNASIVIVKMDKDVLLPVADNALVQSEKNGRIVINVYQDGSYTPENFKDVKFGENDIEGIYDYLKSARQQQLDSGYQPKLHLRGDTDALFRYSRKVIRVAARAGLKDVIFVSYKDPAAAKAASNR